MRRIGSSEDYGVLQECCIFVASSETLDLCSTKGYWRRRSSSKRHRSRTWSLLFEASPIETGLCQIRIIRHQWRGYTKRRLRRCSVTATHLICSRCAALPEGV